MSQCAKMSGVLAGMLTKADGVEKQLIRQQIRLLSLSSANFKKDEVHPGYAKLKAKMERFQIDDGTPVHLKGGTKDVILYYSTLGLALVGLGACLRFYYTLAFPKKPE